MKKFLFLIFLLPTFLVGQEISYTYTFDNPKVEQKDNYVTINFENTLQSGYLGEPILPYKAVQLLLEPGSEAYDVSFEYKDLVTLKTDRQIYPKQSVKPVSQVSSSVNFVKKTDVYKSNEYPIKSFGKLTTQIYRGHSIANVAFTPIKYNPKDNIISYYSSVVVTVKYRKSNSYNNTIEMIKPTADIKTIVDNPNMCEVYNQYYSQKSDDNYDILIISTPDYKDGLEEIANEYQKYGLISEFKNVNDIYLEYEGIDDPEKIRNCIIDKYKNNSIEYVLLGGDIEIVPFRGFYCSVESSTQYVDDNIPSDLYFSSLDGNWNDNNNNLWAEIGEEDLYPEISVGRMPFSNSNEFNSMKNKILMYQFNPILDELNKPLLAGEHLYWDPISYGSDYLDLLIGLRDDNGYTTNGIPPTDPYDTLYAKYVNWEADDIINKINGGPSFIHHLGHSNWNYTMMLFNEDITNTNFNKVDGIQHNFPVIYTEGCICGAFDNDDCIAEHMLKIDNFAVAGCFNSRYGWFNEGQTEGPSLHLHREFTNALYTDKISEFGRIQKQSKIKTAPWVNAPGQWEEGALRWCFYDCNSLGFPALTIWRDNPYTLNAEYNQEIFFTDKQYTVKVTNDQNNPIEGARCIILNQGNDVIGVSVTDDKGVCIINIENQLSNEDKLFLYVSDYNTLPHKFDLIVNQGDGFIDESEALIDIYPNPFVEVLNISTNSNNNTLNIYDINGIKVYTANFNKELNANLDILNKGVYIVEISNNTQTKQFKVVKE
ncbi:MAG: C25 family cysteine peptidase [Bacteroidales bacterium]